jgi:hypothetical protein
MITGVDDTVVLTQQFFPWVFRSLVFTNLWLAQRMGFWVSLPLIIEHRLLNMDTCTDFEA